MKFIGLISFYISLVNMNLMGGEFESIKNSLNYFTNEREDKYLQRLSIAIPAEKKVALYMCFLDAHNDKILNELYKSNFSDVREMALTLLYVGRSPQHIISYEETINRFYDKPERVKRLLELKSVLSNKNRMSLLKEYILATPLKNKYKERLILLKKTENTNFYKELLGDGTQNK